jgi:hypothetical protein
MEKAKRNATRSISIRVADFYPVMAHRFNFMYHAQAADLPVCGGAGSPILVDGTGIGVAYRSPRPGSLENSPHLRPFTCLARSS